MGEKDYGWTSTPQSGRSVRFETTTTHTIMSLSSSVAASSSSRTTTTTTAARRPAQVRVSLSLSIFALNGRSSSPNCLNHVSRACDTMITFTNSFVWSARRALAATRAAAKNENEGHRRNGTDAGTVQRRVHQGNITTTISLFHSSVSFDRDLKWVGVFRALDFC